MKVFLIIFVSVSLLIVVLSFLSPSSNEEDKNASDHHIKKVQHKDYRTQYKRRDFIRERREEQLAVLKEYRGDSQKTARTRHDDFKFQEW